MAPTLQLIGDTIYATGPSFEQYTPREVGVRDAMFVLTSIFPLVAAALNFFSSPNWADRKNHFTFSKVCALWFASIGMVGVALYYLHGVSPRIVFVVAVLHGQFEVMMNVLLLNGTGKQALFATWLWAAFQYGFTLCIADPRTLYLIVAIVGGTNDFMMVQSFLYGGQWGLALGAFLHVISAVTVFVGISGNFGVVEWNVITFFALWGHIFFMTWYNLNKKGAVKGVNAEGEQIYAEPPANPLHYVKFPAKVIAGNLAFCITGSTVITIFLAYYFPQMIAARVGVEI
ncbi:hypothetical protein FRC03_000756 [Tulasnella sp. 419]|nr:hypothetical protein FRC02_000217 [Tulasnella sp. 418]KAG8948314.1 hypothetical protein FRC03_000756 [Tulasnella sp. 419]